MPHEQQQQQRDGAKAHHHQQQVPDYIQRLGDLLQQHTDLELLLQLAATAAVPTAAAAAADIAAAPVQCANGIDMQPRAGTAQTESSSSSSSSSKRCRIAVARDEAFCFYYHDNLSLLQAAGAELVYFSPLHDNCLPGGISGIYLGGGYPERHLQQLSSKAVLLQQLRSFAAAGGVVYAECGGLIYLSKGVLQRHETAGSSSNSSAPACSQQQQQLEGGGITNSSSSSRCGEEQQQQQQQQLVPLAVVLPFSIRMGGMKMGYVEVEVLHNNPLFPAGVTARGQMYHFSEVVTEVTGAAAAAAKDLHRDTLSCSSSSLRRTYQLQQLLPGAVPVPEGYSIGSVLASYVHLHFGGCPRLQQQF
jgi:cobyrinic acid a,c-diamide synthase